MFLLFADRYVKQGGTAIRSPFAQYVQRAIFLREQLVTAECEVFGCSERRDNEIKLAQRVLSRSEAVIAALPDTRVLIPGCRLWNRPGISAD